MKRVVDASYLMSYLIPDERVDEVGYKKLHSGKMDLTAPELLKFEVGNVLLLALKRKRLTMSMAEEVLRSFAELPIVFEKINESGVFLLAQKYNLTFYDASYVWLAKKLNVNLLTRDRKMLAIVSD